MPAGNRYSRHELIPAGDGDEPPLQVGAKCASGHQVSRVRVPQQAALCASITVLAAYESSQRMSQLHCCLEQRLARTSIAENLPSTAFVLHADRWVEDSSHHRVLS